MHQSATLVLESQACHPCMHIFIWRIWHGKGDDRMMRKPLTGNPGIHLTFLFDLLAVFVDRRASLVSFGEREEFFLLSIELQFFQIYYCSEKYVLIQQHREESERISAEAIIENGIGNLWSRWKLMNSKVQKPAELAISFLEASCVCTSNEKSSRVNSLPWEMRDLVLIFQCSFFLFFFSLILGALRVVEHTQQLRYTYLIKH